MLGVLSIIVVTIWCFSLGMSFLSAAVGDLGEEHVGIASLIHISLNLMERLSLPLNFALPPSETRLPQSFWEAQDLQAKLIPLHFLFRI